MRQCFALFLVLFALSAVGCATSDQTDTSPSSLSASSSPYAASVPSRSVNSSARSAAAVGEGAECGPLGATARFSDGSTAHCARLAGTDGGVWAREPGVAPNPNITTTSPAIEYANCGPLGATAQFADGSTAYCARLAGTDGGVWAREPGVAPNPNLPQQTPEQPAQTGPSLGAPCIGAEIGRTATDANGNPIICNDYQWQPNEGQTPSHPWADDQREWAECRQTRTEEECRSALGR